MWSRAFYIGQINTFLERFYRRLLPHLILDSPLLTRKCWRDCEPSGLLITGYIDKHALPTSRKGLATRHAL